MQLNLQYNFFPRYYVSTIKMDLGLRKANYNKYILSCTPAFIYQSITHYIN